MSKVNEPIEPPKPPPTDWHDVADKKLASMRYGAIHLIVQDSKVIQIETTERVRFEKPLPTS